MNFRKTIEDKILFILFTYKKEFVAASSSETAFDIIRKHGLKFEDFSDRLNQLLYKSIQNQLYSGLSDMDLINIVAYRPQEFKVFEQQANEFVTHIYNLTNTNFAAFAELDRLIYKLKEFNVRDFLKYKGQEIMSANFDNLDPVVFADQFIAQYQEFYQRLTSGVITATSNSDDTAKDLEAKMNARQAGQIVGIPIHLESFQNFFGGWTAPDLTIIAARPGMGKTSFILASCWESQIYADIVFFTLEMSPRQLKNRLASSMTNIEYNNIERALINMEEFTYVTQAYKIIDESKLHIKGIEFGKLEKMKTEIRRLHRLGKCKMVVIDYLQLVQSESKHQSREQEVSHISRQLKTLAVELNIPIIALSQVGRSCEERNNKRPLLSDLRESGAIEQDADNVVFLFREAYYFDKNISIPYHVQWKTEFIVAKGRNIGVTTLYFLNDVLHSKILDVNEFIS